MLVDLLGCIMLFSRICIYGFLYMDWECSVRYEGGLCLWLVIGFLGSVELDCWWGAWRLARGLLL